ncbi:Nitrogenase molybdenum-iron protein beta chain [compost metagenome]
MGQTTAGNRNSCLLHGALQTIRAIEGAVPIIHSSAGCGVQQYLGGSTLSGNGGSGSGGGLSVPSTNFLERQVVFGGTSRLREQLKNTVKIKAGDFYAVLTGCTPELVGDDVPAMTKELQEQQVHAIHLGTPGFKGSVHNGYTAALLGILRQYDKLGVTEGERNGRLVNLFGVIPEQDVHWRGNLAGLKLSFEDAGAEVNVIFGPDAARKEWAALRQASLNVSFSVHSLEICEWLERHAGIPYVHFDGYPVGVAQTGGVLRCVLNQLDLEPDALETQIKAQERRERYYIREQADAYYRYGFQKRLAVVGDSAAAISQARFLADPLGLLPVLIVITDNLPESAQERIVHGWQERHSGLETRIVFETDGQLIEELLLEEDIELLLGSTIERKTAERKGIPFIPVSFPVAEELVLTRGFAGFGGGIALLETAGSGIIRFAEIRRELEPHQIMKGDARDEQGAHPKPAFSGAEH